MNFFRQITLTCLVCGNPLLNSQSVEAEPISERLALWNDPAPYRTGKPEMANAFITIHHPENANGTAVIICPGGGYRNLVKGPEGSGIAQWLGSCGITGVVLEYRLPDGEPLRPLADAQQAIRTVRAKARNWKCDPNRIGIMGFSAGGHLAATASTHFLAGDPDSTDLVRKASSRPDFAVLIYPVITMGDKTHLGSKANLLGNSPNQKSVESYSNEKQVNNNTPPTFLAHAADDLVVPPENSQMYYDALRAHGVAGQYLLLPSGGHGLNGYKGAMWDAWQDQSLKWLSQQRMIPPQK